MWNPSYATLCSLKKNLIPFWVSMKDDGVLLLSQETQYRSLRHSFVSSKSPAAITIQFHRDLCRYHGKQHRSLWNYLCMTPNFQFKFKFCWFTIIVKNEHMSCAESEVNTENSNNESQSPFWILINEHDFNPPRSPKHMQWFVHFQMYRGVPISMRLSHLLLVEYCRKWNKHGDVHFQGETGRYLSSIASVAHL